MDVWVQISQANQLSEAVNINDLKETLAKKIDSLGDDLKKKIETEYPGVDRLLQATANSIKDTFESQTDDTASSSRKSLYRQPAPRSFDDKHFWSLYDPDPKNPTEKQASKEHLADIKDRNYFFETRKVHTEGNRQRKMKDAFFINKDFLATSEPVQDIRKSLDTKDKNVGVVGLGTSNGNGMPLNVFMGYADGMFKKDIPVFLDPGNKWQNRDPNAKAFLNDDPKSRKIVMDKEFMQGIYDGVRDRHPKMEYWAQRGMAAKVNELVLYHEVGHIELKHHREKLGDLFNTLHLQNKFDLSDAAASRANKEPDADLYAFGYYQQKHKASASEMGALKNEYFDSLSKDIQDKVKTMTPNNPDTKKWLRDANIELGERNKRITDFVKELEGKEKVENLIKETKEIFSNTRG